MKWPWTKRRETITQREEAEARAAEVHVEVTLPLREMRLANHLTEAIFQDIRRNLDKKEGS